MNRKELHNELSKLLYIEDFNLVDTLIASVVANSRDLDPVWLTIIGASSAGKSQFLRPMAKSNPGLFLQVDDLTSNTLISGNGASQSMIFRIKGRGIIVVDDMTVVFSKNAEDRNAILSQLRMIYDGRMTKGTGKGTMITWEGHAGFIAGSTPTIYRSFSEVADMGERFICYRMKNIDEDKAMDFIHSHGYTAKQLDEKITALYTQYFKELAEKVRETPIIELDEESKKRIEEVAKAATKFRTPVIIDEREHFVSEFVVPEMPWRVYKQLKNIGSAFMLMHFAETGETKLPEELITAIEWCAYSIADDKRRAFFKAVIGLNMAGAQATPRNISAYTGLHKTAVERGMSILSAIGVVQMDVAAQGSTEKKYWTVKDRRLESIVKRIDPPKVVDKEDYQEEVDV